MANLDDFQAIQRLDQENILGNIQDFPEQISRCWQIWQKTSLPTPFIKAKSVPERSASE